MSTAAEIRFTVIGDPKPGGSKKAFRHPQTDKIIVTDDSGKAGREWRREVREAALSAMGDRPPLKGPLQVTMTFLLSRPKGHYGSGRNADRIKDSSPPFPITRPDVLKLARAAEDSMTRIVYADDAQIVNEHLFKRYIGRGQTGVKIVVTELLDQPGLL